MATVAEVLASIGGVMAPPYVGLMRSPYTDEIAAGVPPTAGIPISHMESIVSLLEAPAAAGDGSLDDVLVSVTDSGNSRIRTLAGGAALLAAGAFVVFRR